MVARWLRTVQQSAHRPPVQMQRLGDAADAVAVDVAFMHLLPAGRPRRAAGDLPLLRRAERARWWQRLRIGCCGFGGGDFLGRRRWLVLHRWLIHSVCFQRRLGRGAGAIGRCLPAPLREQLIEGVRHILVG